MATGPDLLPHEADGVFLSCTGAGNVELVATAERALDPGRGREPS